MIQLTSRELKDFFVGTLLGDSYIYNNTFQCKQISKDLIQFKYDIIQYYIPDCEPKIKAYSAYRDKNGTNHQEYYQLSTKPHPYFRKLREEFYPNGSKIIPKKYMRKLSPLGYAMWYADDGTTILVGINDNGSANNRRVQFCTDGFTIKDVEDMATIIASQYGKTSLVNRNQTMRRIQIGTYDAQKFLIDIYPYFINYFPSLLYKIDMGYRNESLTKRRYVTEEYQNVYLEISAHPLFIDRLKDR